LLNKLRSKLERNTETWGKERTVRRGKEKVAFGLPNYYALNCLSTIQHRKPPGQQ
jgi:hypothetical protein